MTDNAKVFHIQMSESSYIFRVLPSGHLEQLYFGKKIKEMDDYSPLYEKFEIEYPNTVIYNQAFGYLTQDLIKTEYSSIGKGDFRESPMEMIAHDGSFVCDFIFKEARQYAGKQRIVGLPSAHDELEQCHTIEIDLVDVVLDLTLTLYYHAFYESNVITRYAKLSNGEKGTIHIRKMMSLQLDLPPANYHLLTLNGAWAREAHLEDKPLRSGIHINDSKTGTSSNRHNPFMIIRTAECTEHAGGCYGFNLIYSGNHCELVEVSPHGFVRVLSGINPHCFATELGCGESFTTPEAILSYSHKGLNGLSQNMHKFVNHHIVPSRFKNKPRPILINNWEATYFDFNEKKLLTLAKDAAALGVELFVLDDGWFGMRNNDQTSLGDWFVNKTKLPSGLNNLSQKINDLGMDFGLWVEPEMISIESELFKRHPEWAVQVPNRSVSFGRNQLVLDFTNQEVRQYIIEVLSQIMNSANISYIKWDMNRHITDMYSDTLGVNKQGLFFHHYVLGLYEVIETLTNQFPHVLFEGCASGGNRFDLGILCYMPQIWASDDTDAFERLKIQSSLSYGYPLSTMGAHVSASPNHQTLRQSSIETRFNVAAFGVLGYELNVSDLESLDKKAMKAQIEFYKEYRELLQFGHFYRIQTKDINNPYIWMCLTADKSKAILGYYQNIQKPNPNPERLYTVELDESKRYQVENRTQKLNVKVFGDLINAVSPVHIKPNGMVHHIVAKVYEMDIEKHSFVAYGDLLNQAGFTLKQQFLGTGLNENVRVLGDFGSRLYVVNEQTK